MRITCSTRTAAEVRAWAEKYAAGNALPIDEVLQAIARGLSGQNKAHGFENRIYEDFPNDLRLDAALQRGFDEWGAQYGMSFVERLTYELEKLPKKP